MNTTDTSISQFQSLQQGSWGWKSLNNPHPAQGCPAPESGCQGAGVMLSRRQCTQLPTDHALLSINSPCNTPSIRDRMGGKGFYLKLMQDNGLRVPPFECIETRVLRGMETLSIDVELIKKYVPGFPDSNQRPDQTHTLSTIKEWINGRSVTGPTNQGQCLDGLSRLIASDDFYTRVKDQPQAQEIRSLYDKLSSPDNLPGNPVKPIIVRSSGVAEDDYGDAQAGRYQSPVHAKGDIVRTCLQVMASGYTSRACPGGVPAPMAIILQECVQCRFGGVAMSHTSLQDDTIQFEYGPGQPRGTVGGQSGNTPHCYRINRNTNGAPPAEFIPGDTPVRFDLKRSVANGSFAEVKTTTVPSNPVRMELSGKMIEEIRQAIVIVEKLLRCPANLEIAININDTPYFIQARPAVSLPGAMEFRMPLPEKSLFRGERISDGWCTGPLIGEDAVCPGRNPAGAIPAGAIIAARHGRDWMFEPAVLGRVGGFVFQNAGIYDHVGINLRQQGKPCLRTDKMPFPGSGVTLVCGNINGRPDALLLAGNQREQLEKAMVQGTGDYNKALKSVDDWKKTDISFHRPDTGTQWFYRHHDKLLDYFNPDRLLHLCLSSAGSLQLSLSADRGRVAEKLQEEFAHLLADLQILVAGFECFLTLPQKGKSRGVEKHLDEIQPLFNKIKALGGKAQAQLFAITRYLVPDQQFIPAECSVSQWRQNCTDLQANLQGLNRPDGIAKVKTFHDMIFWLHQRFNESLAYVGENSTAARIEKNRSSLYCYFLPPTETGLLNGACKEVIDDSRSSLVVMKEAVIINTKLGHGHFSIVRMLEQAEGGKGRTLQLIFADDVFKGGLNQGALKRFWFLTMLLQAQSLDSDSDPVHISVKKNVGKIEIQYNHFKTKTAVQSSFVKLFKTLLGLYNLDWRFEKKILGEESAFWDFSILERRIRDGLTTEKNKFSFKYCLFLAGYQAHPNNINIDTISQKYSDFYSYGIGLYRSCKPILCGDELRNFFKMNELVAFFRKKQKENLLYFFLISDPEYAETIVTKKYSHWLEIRSSVIDLVRQNGMILGILSRKFIQDEEVVRYAIKQNARAACYVPLRDIILAAIKDNPEVYLHCSSEFKQDREILHTALRHGYSSAFCHSGELRNDEEAALMAVNICGKTLGDASDRLRNTPEVVLAAIAQNPDAFICCGKELASNKSFLLKALNVNKQVFNHFSETMQQDQDIRDVAFPGLED